MLEQFGLQFHHFGLAVKDPALALKFLDGLGYRQEKQVFDPLQNVNLSICRHNSMPDVEVVSPAAKGSGPVDNLLSRRPEGIVYHICYTSDDVSRSLKDIEDAGFRILEVAAAKPAVLFGGRPVSFYMIAGIGLIEIMANRVSAQLA